MTRLPHIDGSGRGMDDGECTKCGVSGSLAGEECPVRLRAALDATRRASRLPGGAGPRMMLPLSMPDPPTRWAALSPCGRYRYTLGRRWSPAGRTAVWVMLNPSVADADVDDPTIRRCMGFSRREGCASLVVVNLYAFRATKPAELLAEPEPTGPDNRWWLSHMGAQAHDRGDLVIVAWGDHKAATPEVVSRTVRLLTWHRPHLRLHCLGTTKDGAPRHPLYVRSDQPLVDWSLA